MLNKRHNSNDCSEPPDRQNFDGFLVPRSFNEVGWFWQIKTRHAFSCPRAKRVGHSGIEFQRAVIPTFGGMTPTVGGQ